MKTYKKIQKYLFYLLSILFFALVYYFEIYEKEKTETAKAEHSQLFKSDAKEIAVVKINNLSENLILELKKDDISRADSKTKDTWSLVSPFNDWVDGDAIEKFLTDLLAEKEISALELDQVAREQDFYGFKDPKGSLEVMRKDGTGFLVTLSKTKNFEGNSFLILKNLAAPGSVEGANATERAVLASASFHSYLERDGNSFREQSLFLKDPTQIETFQVIGTELDFKKESGGSLWLNQSSPEILLDQEKVRDFIYKWTQGKGLRVIATEEDFATEAKGAKTFKSYNIKSNPEYRLLFGLKSEVSSEGGVKLKEGVHGNLDKREIQVFLAKSGKEIFAFLVNEKRLYALNSSFFEDLKKAKLTDYRDRKSFFAFDAQKVTRLVSKNPNLELALGADQIWGLDEKKSQLKPNEEFNRDAFVSSFFNLLKQFKAEEFSNEPLKENEVTGGISLLNSSGELVFTIQIGKEFSSKQEGQEKKLIWVQTQNYKNAVAIEKAVLEQLKSYLVKKREEK